MVYVRLVAEEEPDARVVAEASLRMSGWSPEKVHQKRKGKRALRRAVTTLTKQRKAAEQRAELQRARPNISADMALAEEHREVRRCTRRVEHQLRGAGVTVSMRKLIDSTLKLSAAMEKDRPPHAMYATHRAWLSQQKAAEDDGTSAASSTASTVDAASSGQPAARYTGPLLVRAAANAKLRQFDAALLDVVEVLKIQPEHPAALAMQPTLLAHLQQQRQAAACDRSVTARPMPARPMTADGRGAPSDGPALRGTGGAAKRCGKHIPIARAFGAQLGSRSATASPLLKAAFSTGVGAVQRDRPYASFWRSVKPSSAALSQWRARPRDTSPPESGAANTDEDGGVPAASHWDYVVARVGDLLKDDEQDRQALRRRLLRNIELLSQVFEIYSRLGTEAVPAPTLPHLLVGWQSRLQQLPAPATIHPSRLEPDEVLGKQWRSEKDSFFAAVPGEQHGASWSQLSSPNISWREESMSRPNKSAAAGWESDSAAEEELSHPPFPEQSESEADADEFELVEEAPEEEDTKPSAPQSLSLFSMAAANAATMETESETESETETEEEEEVADEEEVEEADDDGRTARGIELELPHDRPDTVVTLHQLRQLALDCRIVGQGCSAATLNRICHHSCRAPGSEPDAADNESAGSWRRDEAIAAVVRDDPSEEDCVDIHDLRTEVHIHEFLECLIRLSCHLNSGEGRSCADSFEQLLFERILPSSGFQTTTHPLRWKVLEPEPTAVLRRFSPGLADVFVRIAGCRGGFPFTPPASQTSGCVDMPIKLNDLLRFNNMLPRRHGGYSTDMLLALWETVTHQSGLARPHVGLHHILKGHRAHEMEENEGAEMIFGEFLELIAMLALKCNEGSKRPMRDIVTKFVTREFFVLAGKTLNIEKAKLLETPEKRQAKDDLAQSLGMAIVHDDEVGRKWRELSSEHVSEAARVGRERARVYAEFGSPRDSSE